MALSADGNTALIGGPADNNGAGAAWVFTRSDHLDRSRQKLVGDRRQLPPPTQGSQRGVVGGRNTALIGGPGNNFRCGGGVGVHPLAPGPGASRARKLVGTGASGGAKFRALA